VDALRLRGVTWHPPLPEDANKDGKTRQVDAPTFDLAYGASAAVQIEHLLDYIYGAPQRAYVAPAADAPDAPKAYVPLVEVTAPATQPTAAGPETKPAGDPSVASGKPTKTNKPAINGSIKLKGKPPMMPVITAMNSVKECIGQHKDPPREETIVADDQGNLANVVVYVSSGLTQPFAPPKEPAVLEQKGCQYVPHVLPVMVGQPLAARNDDGFLHNVHTLPQKNDVSNQSQPTKQTDVLKPVTTAEVFKAKCDVHPWMSAWIVALDNPFFGASAEDGTYAIQGLPPGKYTLTAWHESLGQQKKEVTVTAGEPVTVDFEFTVK
jgi:plastocyanin